MKFRSRHALLLLLIGTFSGHKICAVNIKYDFYQHIRDIITYQKELAAATATLTYLAYASPSLDFRRQLAGIAVASYFAAKLFTPRRNLLEGLITIAAYESGYNEVNYAYPLEKQFRKKNMEKLLRNFSIASDNLDLKNDIDAFIDTIDELTETCTIQKNNPGITNKELKKKIAIGFNTLDDLIKNPSKIKNNDVFKNFGLRRLKKHLEQ